MPKDSPKRRALPPIDLPEPQTPQEAVEQEIFHHKRAGLLRIWEIRHLYGVSTSQVYHIYDRVALRHGVGLEHVSPQFRQLLELKSREVPR